MPLCCKHARLYKKNHIVLHSNPVPTRCACIKPVKGPGCIRTTTHPRWEPTGIVGVGNGNWSIVGPRGFVPGSSSAHHGQGERFNRDYRLYGGWTRCLDLPRLLPPAIGLDHPTAEGALPLNVSRHCTVADGGLRLNVDLLPLRATVACEAREDQWEPSGPKLTSLMPTRLQLIPC